MVSTRAFLPALLGAILLVGCNKTDAGPTTAATTGGASTTTGATGGGDSTNASTERLTLEAYNAAVKKAGESMAALGTEAPKFQQEIQTMSKSDPEAVKKKTQEFIDSMKGKFDAFITEIRGIRPPEDLDNFHTTFVNGMEEMGTVFNDLTAAIAKMDQAAIQAASTKAQEIGGRVMPQIQKAASDAGYEMDPAGGLRKKGTGGTAGAGGEAPKAGG